MPRPKGLPKSGGRVKGTPNKIKIEARMMIADFVIRNFNEFVTCWQELPSNSPVKFNSFINLIKYVLPVPVQEAENEASEIQIAIRNSIINSKKIENEG